MPLNTFAPIRNQFLAGKSTPRDHFEATLAAIEALEPTLHAFAALTATSGRRAADESTKRYQAGKPLSPLDGCPVGIKDIIETVDAPTQMNSPVFAGWESHRDAPSVLALRKAGALVVGKTHTTEFAIGRSAPTTNPYDTARTPGGSSSGSAAAVGAGVLALALGTQTAGSILRPASYCGAYGFKPSHGLLPVGGIHPLSRSLDTLGTIAASLEDAWQGARQIWRWTGSDDWRLGLADDAVPEAALQHHRIGWLRTDGWERLDDASEQAFHLLVSKLRAAGVEVVDAHAHAGVERIEGLLKDVADLNTQIVQAEIRYPMSVYYERDRSQLSERIQSMLQAGASISGEQRAALLKRQQMLRSEVDTLRAELDGFITMASTGPAPVGLDNTGDRTFLSPWSVVGGPAFSLPLMEVDNLPVGLQLMGFYANDADLAAVAAWIADHLA